MELESFAKELTTVCPGVDIMLHEPMSRHTTFKVGGAADLYVAPSQQEQLVCLVNMVKKADIPLTVIGAGSNLLVKDGGIRGVVLSTRDFQHIELSGNEIIADSGVSMAALSNFALKNSLTGLEFALGIPGTLGGGLYMNCGAYDGEISKLTVESYWQTPDGELRTIIGDEHKFGYRNSVFMENPDGIILGAKLRLEPGDASKIFEKMNDFTIRRRASQPIELPSAGSTFKRPKGYFAGKLISDAGLKGLSVGGARVSEKHAGFIVNIGGATAGDILELIKQVKDRVYNSFGVHIEEEVRIVGEDVNL